MIYIILINTNTKKELNSLLRNYYYFTSVKNSFYYKKTKNYNFEIFHLNIQIILCNQKSMTPKSFINN